MYRHIKQYAQEITELQKQGYSQRQIGEKLGFGKAQIKSYIHRVRGKERKIATGVAIKKKGRPAKDSIVTKEDRGFFALSAQFFGFTCRRVIFISD